MKITEFKEDRKISLEKWREYLEASKKSKDPMYSDMRKVYHFLKLGYSVVDIFDIIKEGGITDQYHPKLAIAPADTKRCQCFYYKDGRVVYNDPSTSWRKQSRNVEISGFPIIPNSLQANYFSRLNLETAVPVIPPKLMPEWLSKDYYILWEVDKWEIMPPGDPYLLKRITPNMFVVLGSWDLTPLEKAVMKGRL